MAERQEGLEIEGEKGCKEAEHSRLQVECRPPKRGAFEGQSRDNLEQSCERFFGLVNDELWYLVLDIKRKMSPYVIKSYFLWG